VVASYLSAEARPKYQVRQSFVEYSKSLNAHADYSYRGDDPH
jgi:hypothetical protein